MRFSLLIRSSEIEREQDTSFSFEMVSNAIDAFERSTARKTATVRAAARKSDSAAWQRWPHVAKPVKTYLETLKWEVLLYPPYSSDIAPSDYYLFRSMAHGLADQQFHSSEDIEKWLDSWTASKDEHFYRNGIRALPEIWAKHVANDGQYFKWFICNHFFTIKLHFHKKKQRELSCAPNT